MTYTATNPDNCRGELTCRGSPAAIEAYRYLEGVSSGLIHRFIQHDSCYKNGHVTLHGGKGLILYLDWPPDVSLPS